MPTWKSYYRLLVLQMPTLNEIQRQVLKSKNTAQDEIRRKYLKNLSDYTERDTIVYASAFTLNQGLPIPQATLAVSLQDLHGFMSAINGLQRKKLDLIIHSPGGSLEATEQLVLYLRSKYENIRAIIPQNAMSAATMLACACDSIVMGKHSAIGPIDPQLTMFSQNKPFTVAAQSVLDEFDQAKEDVRKDPQSAVIWVEKLKSYPPGFLNMCKRQIDLSVKKAASWLDTYMFKDVDEDKPGETIAAWLGDANEHRTHGRPINIDLARKQGLVVEPLEKDQKLQELVLSVFHSVMVTFMVTPCVKIVENHEGKGLYLRIDIKQTPVS